jgi:hypothetical protein
LKKPIQVSNNWKPLDFQPLDKLKQVFSALMH